MAARLSSGVDAGGLSHFDASASCFAYRRSVALLDVGAGFSYTCLIQRLPKGELLNLVQVGRIAQLLDYFLWQPSVLGGFDARLWHRRVGTAYDYNGYQ